MKNLADILKEVETIAVNLRDGHYGEAQMSVVGERLVQLAQEGTHNLTTPPSELVSYDPGSPTTTETDMKSESMQQPNWAQKLGADIPFGGDTGVDADFGHEKENVEREFDKFKREIVLPEDEPSFEQQVKGWQKDAWEHYNRAKVVPDGDDILQYVIDAWSDATGLSLEHAPVERIKEILGMTD